MSLQHIKLDNSVKELEKLKALLELTILKNASNRESQGEIEELLLKTTLSSDQDGTQTSVADKINVIKSKLLTTSSADKANTFAFEIKTFSLESVLEDLNKSNLLFNEYIQSFGNNNIVYISKTWEEGTAEYKRNNLNTKYVKISDTNTPRQGYTISNSFSFGIQGQIQKLISYLDAERKIINWEGVMSELKCLAKSSGYTCDDVKIGLMGLLRLGNLNQDLYEDMSIDEIANSLIKSVKPLYKTSILWNTLRSLERQINTPLQLVLAEAESYIRKLFPDEKQKRIRENYCFIALTSFVNDSLSMEISNEIKRKKELNEYYSYEAYKENCIKLEMTESNIPTQVLKYGRHIKKSSSIQEESLHNTSMNNIQDKLNTINTETSDEELDFQYYNICNRKNNPVFNVPVKKDIVPLDQSSLGTCFGDRSEDDITTFVKYNNSYYSVPLKNCDVRMQLALLSAMKQGRVNQTLDLLWDDNERYMTKISKDEFNNAKLLGCKPSNRWADKRELTLNIALTTEMNKARAHRSESDSYESTNGDEDSEVTALNNTTYNTGYKNRNQRDYSQYKPLYNNDNYYNNRRDTNNRTSERDQNYNNTNGYNTPYYRNRSSSTGTYRNSMNYRNNQYKEDKPPNYNDRQRYENGYQRRSDRHLSKDYRDNNRSPRDNRSPSWNRTTQDRYQRPRSLSANNTYDRNRIRRNSSSFDRDRRYSTYNNGDRNRSQSNDRQQRYQSDRSDKDKQGDRPRYNREDRSISRDRYRTRERGRSTERRRYTDSQYNKERSTNRRDRESVKSRQTSRDNSLEIRLRYPKFKPGDNCDSNYNPSKVKLCRKCSLKGVFNHHEFECRRYSKFNDYPCKKCHDGFHFEKECSNSNSKAFNIGEEESEKNAIMG